MKIAIMQPHFFPWIGFFELMQIADLMLILDDAQISKQSWQNRNLFITSSGVKWKTAAVSGSSHMKLCEINLHRADIWLAKMERHFLVHPGYKGNEPIIDNLFIMLKNSKISTLAELNLKVIHYLRTILQIETPIILTSTIPTSAAKDQKIIQILEYCKASSYVAADGSREYITEYGESMYPCKIDYFRYQRSKEISIFYDKIGYENSLDLILRIGLQGVKNAVF